MRRGGVNSGDDMMENEAEQQIKNTIRNARFTLLTREHVTNPREYPPSAVGAIITLPATVDEATLCKTIDLHIPDERGEGGDFIVAPRVLSKPDAKEAAWLIIMPDSSAANELKTGTRWKDIVIEAQPSKPRSK
jgi:hypothetical protein